MKVILSGVVGSKCHADQVEGSDTDRFEVFIHSTSDILSVNPPSDHFSTQDEEGDFRQDELMKFVKAAIKGDTQSLDLLYTPIGREWTMEGALLVMQREAFVSQNTLKSLCGHAKSDLMKASNHVNEPIETWWKKIRKTTRMHAQAYRLFREGQYRCGFSDEEWEKLDAVRSRIQSSDTLQRIAEIEWLIHSLESMAMNVDSSPLPKTPNFDKINEVIRVIRKDNFDLTD